MPLQTGFVYDEVLTKLMIFFSWYFSSFAIAGRVKKKKRISLYVYKQSITFLSAFDRINVFSGKFFFKLKPLDEDFLCLSRIPSYYFLLYLIKKKHAKAEMMFLLHPSIAFYLPTDASVMHSISFFFLSFFFSFISILYWLCLRHSSITNKRKSLENRY